ncbi:MAG: pyrroline-5-carboxylate reductase [Phycisphaerae bacterium]|nr:pyrroline-5-carboxylate reductase [Phycisphaerae bacterium]
MNKKYKLGFCGFGKMASAILNSIVSAGLILPDEVCFFSPRYADGSLSNETDFNLVKSNAEVFANSDIVFLGFKPQNFPDAIEGIKAHDEQLVVSIMAGVKIADIEAQVGGQVVRVMPNICCLVGHLAGAITFGHNVSVMGALAVRNLIGIGGVVVEVSEDELEEATGISGSGPAFVAYLVESFIQAGIAAGMDREIAKSLTLKTFAGTAELLMKTDITTGQLIDMVSSPNGTTVAGRSVLEPSDVRETLKQTIAKAIQRSKELGQRNC